MSAQLAQHAPVRLLIAERSENAAYQFDSLLRDAGIATRPEIIDLPMAIDKLAHADMMICNAALPELKQLLPRLFSLAPRVPIILINNDEVSFGQAEGMELGAADVVSEADSHHLVLVVKRELEHVCRNIQYRQMKKALAEAEQRCQLLLESSRAAIAYVHEGMHIHANEHYLKLFGFDGVDDLLGLPLIDMMDSESATTLKDRLKAFRANGEETEFEFTGISTTGEAVLGSMTLDAAEYEGEHCLQVTVRPQIQSGVSLSLVSDQGLVADQPAAQQSLSDQSDSARPAAADSGTSQPDEIDDVPVLDAQAIVTQGEVPVPGEADDADTGADGAIEFELEMETDGPAAEAEADSDPLADVPTDAAREAATETGEGAAGEHNRIMPLPEFISASATLAAEYDGQFVSIFVAQVDGYEDLQRAFGLSGVDDACRKVAAVLLERVNAPFVQISPSQWAMLICGKTREDAINIADGHRAAVENLMFEIREKTVRPTCTFGGAILNAEGNESATAALEATLDNAITTLRAALEAGNGNTVKLPAFDNAEQEYDDEANRVLSLITEAIENQSFTLLFQPIISLRGDSDEHYEVFLRMSDREGNQMAPGEFLRTAIDNNVAGKIDRWVILQSIKMLSQHRANGHNTRLTINLTSNSVADPEFIQWLGVAIKAARMPSDAVIFQITELDASTYIRQTREFVEGLKHLHCRSSLSRFGLTEEPFEVLGHIPVDFVKLDGELVEALDNDPNRKNEVAEMVRELQNQGKLTIVPMVESASLLSTLWQAGVNYIQGHYLQEPSTDMDYDFSTDD
jgi:EAL domain-containing protein (putative c-di-GMP-specific phosphodiesterase class I)/PAS domain-containing protein